ncbi:hypothetical protein BG000_004249 [Podila horticola]|nr:hypothetical protein BG000_004249 [Podila horticola]
MLRIGLETSRTPDKAAFGERNIEKHHDQQDWSQTEGMIRLGTPPQSFRVQFSLGSPHSFVYSNSCKECRVRQRTYRSARSSTYHHNGTQFSLFDIYDGFVSQDSLHLAENLVLEGQQFGEIDSYSRYFGMDGKIGLAYDVADESVTATGREPVLVNLRKQGLLDENVLGLYLGDVDRTTWSLGKSGEMTLGGLDAERYHGHDLHWQKTIRPGRWALELKKIYVDWNFKGRHSKVDGNVVAPLQMIEHESDLPRHEGTNKVLSDLGTFVNDMVLEYLESTTDDDDLQANVKAHRKHTLRRGTSGTMDWIAPSSPWDQVPAHLRSETIFLNLPLVMARELNNVIGFTNEHGTKSFLYGCKELDKGTLPYVGVQLGEYIFWLAPEEYLLPDGPYSMDVCYSMFDGEGQGILAGDDLGAMLGNIFMGKFFSALDFEQHRLGFALAK